MEKIAANNESVSRCVAEVFVISTNTVHSYLNELLENKSIQKVKRGNYRLATAQFTCSLKRSEGLDWMGQGFAHQLFVVFRNEHPETRLSPINMCENVETMYRHVLHS